MRHKRHYVVARPHATLSRPVVAAALALAVAGCAASLPPEARPKPYSLFYAKQTLATLKPSWILVHPETVRHARIGKFQAMLVGQSAVCVAYDAQDRSGVYAGLKPYIVFIAPDHASIVQVIPPNSGSPCAPDELQPFPELDSVK